MAADLEVTDLDLAAHFDDARRAGVFVALGEERSVGGDLLAGGPGAGAGDDDPRGIGEDQRFERPVLAGARQLVVKGDQRVLAALATTVLEVHGHRLPM